MTTLEQGINDRSARVAVVGLGYVGFPLAQRATEAGYPVVGIDKYLTDERDKELADAGIHVERGFDSVEQCDIVLICVPTPLVDGEQPDISFITDAVEDIARHLNHTEMLVVLESTSYPGTTREVLLPVLEKAGKRLGQGLNLAYAPERVDPGDNRPDYADARESPALRIIELLAERGAEVSYHDPYVERLEIAGKEYVSVPLDEATVGESDCILILTAHSNIDLDLIRSAGGLVVDTRNALRHHPHVKG